MVLTPGVYNSALDLQAFLFRVPRRILVLGGSQGAKTLNEVVPVALALAGVNAQNVSVLHQTGDGMVDEVRKRYRGLGIDAVEHAVSATNARKPEYRMP